jgi:membrane associated rhomboid family serine protease
MQFNFFRTLTNVLALTWARVHTGFLSHSWITIVLATVVTLLMLIPQADDYLKFDRAAILENGEWWRTFTAVFVHSSWDHYTWNVIVLAASSLVCEQINRRVFVIYLFAMLVANATFKLLIDGGEHSSLGFSGVASGTFVLLLILIIAEGITTRDFWMVVVSTAILVVFSAHELGFLGSQTGWEMLTGHSIDSTPGKKTKPAHVLGMLTGFVVASGYLLTAAVIRKRQ